jgi:uncharacterized protein (DUF58 family)
MNFFKRWFKTSPINSSEESQDTPLKQLLNSGTHVAAHDLIALQQQARKLDLYQSSYASASTTGSHHSRFRGRGMDYQESRLYQAGDDIRNMDWRVTARSGKPHTKLYQEERELPVVLLVDFNLGMFFGSTNSLKSVVAAKTAALIAWAVASRGDRIGALLITEGDENETHKELAPKMGKRGALQLIRELVIHSNPQKAMQSGGNHTSLNEQLKRLRHLAHPGTLVFLISDFYNIDDETSQHIQRLSRHNDIQAIQIIDPLEKSPPPPYRYSVTDGKHTGILNTHSKKGRKRYQEFFNQHHKKVEELMNRHNIYLLQISTADDVLLTLQQRFGSSKKRSSVASQKTSQAV